MTIRCRLAKFAFYLLASLAPLARVEAQAPPSDSVMFLLEAIKVDVAFHGREVGRDQLSPQTLSALAAVPRLAFVPADQASWAFENRAITLGHGRTLPTPSVSALLVDLLDLAPGARVLEIGTGSGYGAALLCHLGAEVYSFEPVSALASAAGERLARLGIEGVRIREGSGRGGWPEAAPFDAIVVALTVPEIPPELLAQLKPGGKMLIALTYGGPQPYLTLVVKNLKGKLRPRPRPLLAVTFERLP